MAERYALLDLSSGGAPGRGVVVPAGGSAEVLDVRASDANGAQLVTLQIGAEIVIDNVGGATPGAGLFWPAAFIHLEWGVHGATHTATADLTRGFGLSLCADFVRARVSLPADVPNRIVDPLGLHTLGNCYGTATGTGPSVAPSLLVQASLSYGTRAGGAGAPRLTNFVATIAATSRSSMIPIPNWARGVCVLAPTTAANVAPAMDLEWFGGAAAATTIAATCNVGSTGAEWQASAIPCGATAVKLRNHEAAPVVRPTLVWLLAL